MDKIKGKASIYDYENTTNSQQSHEKQSYNTANLIKNNFLSNHNNNISDIDNRISELLSCQKDVSENNSVIENKSIDIEKTNLDEEEAKLVPEEVKNEANSSAIAKENALLNNRMRSKKRSEQMKKRLDKVSGEKFYFKQECGIDNGEIDNMGKHKGKVIY